MKRMFSLILALFLVVAIIPNAAYALSEWDGRTSEPFAEGSGTEEDPFVISNAAQLYYLSLITSSKNNSTMDKYYKLTTCIDLKNISFPAINYFYGVFDGNGHTIFGLNISGDENDKVAFIRSAYDATIKNLTVSGTISGGEYAAGIVAYAEHTNIFKCTNQCVINSEGSCVGGICGGITSIADHQHKYAKSEIVSCANTENVSGGGTVGGIVGYVYASGGLFYSQSGSGQTHYYGSVTVSECANAGSVCSTNIACGIAGHFSCSKDDESSLYIRNCYNIGTVIGGNKSYGLVYYNANNKYFEIKNCYNVGVAETSDSAPGNTRNVYCLDGVNPNANNPVGTIGNSREKMTVAAGYSGFDFLNIWSWDSAGVFDFPILANLGVINESCREHQWDEGYIVKEPSCIALGEIHYRCKVCGTERGITLPYTEHLWTERIIQKETCVSDGAKECMCDVCGKTEIITITAIGHNYLSTITKPGCTEIGYTTYTCSHCGDSYKSDYVSALGHNYKVEETAPTCTEKGYTTYTCLCGESYVADEVEALDHDYVDGACTRCSEKDPNYKPPVQENPFTDVSADSVYYDAILWAYYHTPNQITSGYTATEFCPQNPCTRAQVVTFLWRAEGCPEPTGDVSIFKDADDIAPPFLKAVAWAVEKGITTGFADGTFRPNDSVTRAQFVTFLYRFEDKPATNGSIDVFPDAAEIAGPYQQAVAWAVENGITSGYYDGTFRPDDVCTRWAVVLFMYRDMK